MRLPLKQVKEIYCLAAATCQSQGADCQQTECRGFGSADGVDNDLIDVEVTPFVREGDGFAVGVGFDTIVEIVVVPAASEIDSELGVRQKLAERAPGVAGAAIPVPSYLENDFLVLVGDGIVGDIQY